MTKLANSKLKTYLRKALMLVKMIQSPGVTESNALEIHFQCINCYLNIYMWPQVNGIWYSLFGFVCVKQQCPLLVAE